LKPERRRSQQVQEKYQAEKVCDKRHLYCILIIIIKIDETIDHIISTCPILAKKQYMKRHERLCAQLHFNLCKETRGTIEQKTLV